jgi:YesN/AraC family two-component response regulator
MVVRMRVIDITGQIYEGMWNYEEPFPKFEMEPLGEVEWAKTEVFCEIFKGMHSQTGTYLETPAHFYGNENCYLVSDIPIEKLVNIPCYVINLNEKDFNVSFSPLEINYPKRKFIDVNMIKAACNNGKDIAEKSAILIGTGWGKYWREDFYLDKSPYFTYEAIKNLSNAKTKYYYPIDIEQEIINSVKAGNIEKVERLLEDVYSENFKEIQLSGQISQILIYNIISTVIKILDELKIDLSKFEDANILHQLYNAETVNDAYSSLISAYTVICDLVNQNKKSNNRYLFEKIENYLKEEYSNNDISIEFIAEKFNLSTSYLSRFFKEQAGINFYDYLQKLRIEKAKEIFIQNDVYVNLKVGHHFS